MYVNLVTQVGFLSKNPDLRFAWHRRVTCPTWIGTMPWHALILCVLKVDLFDGVTSVFPNLVTVW